MEELWGLKSSNGLLNSLDFTCSIVMCVVSFLYCLFRDPGRPPFDYVPEMSEEDLSEQGLKKNLFDGHGGSDAAAYMRKNAMKFFFEDADFPQGFEVNNVMLEEVENSIRNTFLLADIALGNECTVSSSSGTTALTALILGRLLLVANAGDCRAVLCRKVRPGLSRHDDPEQCARELVMEALRLNTFDNLTVIIVCFSPLDHREVLPPQKSRFRCCNLSAETLCKLNGLLDNDGH